MRLSLGYMIVHVEFGGTRIHHISVGSHLRGGVKNIYCKYNVTIDAIEKRVQNENLTYNCSSEFTCRWGSHEANSV